MAKAGLILNYSRSLWVGIGETNYLISPNLEDRTCVTFPGESLFFIHPGEDSNRPKKCFCSRSAWGIRGFTGVAYKRPGDLSSYITRKAPPLHRWPIRQLHWSSLYNFHVAIFLKSLFSHSSLSLILPLKRALWVFCEFHKLPTSPHERVV